MATAVLIEFSTHPTSWNH